MTRIPPSTPATEFYVYLSADGLDDYQYRYLAAALAVKIGDGEDAFVFSTKAEAEAAASACGGFVTSNARW